MAVAVYVSTENGALEVRENGEVTREDAALGVSRGL
jgi:DNA integrity scanning protein DisA with diadenylate cyclase activity